MSRPALDAALGMSEAMVDAARAGRWDEVAEHAAECDRLLRGWNGGAADASDASAVRRLLELNAEVIAIGESHREELRAAIAGAQGQRRAARAYDSATGNRGGS